jgi:hypothetical protein
MARLSAVVKGLSLALQDSCPTQQLKSLIKSDGQVVLHAVDADDRKLVINLVFLDADEYPRSGVLVQVDEDEDSKCSSKVVEKLGALSERLQDGAQLFAVISKVRTGGRHSFFTAYSTWGHLLPSMHGPPSNALCMSL